MVVAALPVRHPGVRRGHAAPDGARQVQVLPQRQADLPAEPHPDGGRGGGGEGW